MDSSQAAAAAEGGADRAAPAGGPPSRHSEPAVGTRTHRPAPRVLWRALVFALWLALLALAGYAYFVHRDVLSAQLAGALSLSTLMGGAIYVISSCLRGFTLIPSTFLLLAGLPFFPPAPLYLMTMLGIAVSASSLYGFSHLMGI